MVIKAIPVKKKCKRQNGVWGGLTNSWEKKRREKKEEKRKAKEKRKNIPSECRVPKNSEERQESLSENAKKAELFQDRRQPKYGWSILH